MGELEDRLNAVLNDPEQLSKITKMAQSLMGDGEAAGAPPELGELKAMLQRGSSTREQKLLEAMKPYLSEKRRKKVDRALKIARIASIASLAAGEDKGDGNV